MKSEIRNPKEYQNEKRKFKTGEREVLCLDIFDCNFFRISSFGFRI